MEKLLIRLMIVSIFVGALSVATYAKVRNGRYHSQACGEYMYRNDEGKCVDARNKSGKPFVDHILSQHWKP